MSEELERVVRLHHAGRVFTFRVDDDPPLAFWRIESDGRRYLTPLRVTGEETEAFFRALADTAVERHEL